MAIRRESIEDKARRMGLCCGTWAPGDGAVRYRFFRADGVHQHGDYHQGDELATCLGRAEAHVWLNGYHAGLHHKEA